MEPISLVVTVLLLLLTTLVASAQTDPAAGIRSAMESGLQKQRDSVRRQVQSAVPAGAGVTGFFTVPWPAPPAAVVANCDPLAKDKVDDLVTRAATIESLKPDLIRQVMQQESAFRPCAISAKGAQGLMQLMPPTAEELGVRDIFDPEQNTMAGAKYLKQLITRYGGDVEKALAAYNAGPGTVDRSETTVPEIKETQDYVRAILSRVLLD